MRRRLITFPNSAPPTGERCVGRAEGATTPPASPSGPFVFDVDPEDAAMLARQSAIEAWVAGVQPLLEAACWALVLLALMIVAQPIERALATALS